MPSTPSRSPARKSDFVPRLHKLLEDGKGGVAFSWSELNDDFDDAFRITSVDGDACAALAAGGFDFRRFQRISDRRRSLARRQHPVEQEIEFRHPSGFFVPGDNTDLDQIVRKRRERKKSTPKKDDEDELYEDEAAVHRSPVQKTPQKAERSPSSSDLLYFNTPSYPYQPAQRTQEPTFSPTHTPTRSTRGPSNFPKDGLAYPRPHENHQQPRYQEPQIPAPLQLDDLDSLPPHSTGRPYARDGPTSHSYFHSPSLTPPSESPSFCNFPLEDKTSSGIEIDHHYQARQDARNGSRSSSTASTRKVEAQEETQQQRATVVDRKGKRKFEEEQELSSWTHDYDDYTPDYSGKAKHHNDLFETSDPESSLTSLSSHDSDC
ncbi:hypothetical protein MNV49_005151 [Pseudohyphozyma bogoriensis]|nr:hypothetical protein MNV49_005151 [Pseudohyphozyma bogoriensis]